MEVSDRCLLRNQYTYPNSYQYLSTVPISPFQIHSDELEKCVCETHSTGRICPYHEALKVAPQERSGAMKAVVESHDLAIEAGQLLLTTRAHTQHEDFDKLVRLRGAVEASEEGVVLGKAAVKLIKAALLHRGISMHIPLAPLSEFSIRLAYSGLTEVAMEPKTPAFIASFVVPFDTWACGTCQFSGPV
ncbi:g4726 [Coccomyxa elongata]